MSSSITQRWSWLSEEVKRNPELFPGICLTPPDEARPFFLLTEDYKGVRLFEYERYPNGFRLMRVDVTAFVGLSSIDFTNTHLILVEGASDYLTGRLHFKGNVLGKTTPHLSKRQINVIKTMFESVTIMFDNDTSGKSNTYLVSTALKRAGLKVDITTPDSNFKDLTEQIFTRCSQLQKDPQSLQKL